MHRKLFDFRPPRAQTFGDVVGHFFGAAPHRIVHDERFVFGRLRGPFGIQIDDFRRVFAPHKTVVRRNQARRQAHLLHLRQKAQHNVGIRQHDVGVVFFRLVEPQAFFVLVVKQFACGVVHTEYVVGEQDVFFFQIRKHTVRPVQHARFHKRNRIAADVNAVAGFDGF